MPQLNADQNNNRRKYRSSLLGVALFLVGSSLIWGIISNLGALLIKSTPFPIDMHSASQADYSADPEFYQFPPMDIQLVIDAIWDENLDAIHLGARLTQVNENFIASVSSVTPMPSPSDTAEIDPPDGDASQQLTTFTPETPLYSLTPSVSPTQTPPGFIPSQTPTQDLASQTATPPPPTSTTAPPTNTSSPCGQLSLSGFGTDTKRASWNLVNNSSSAISISSISLNWPNMNSSLDKVFFGTGKIWDGDAPPPSTTLTSGWTSSTRTLSGSASAEISFTFLEQSALSGYNVVINFSNGCSVSRSN